MPGKMQNMKGCFEYEIIRSDRKTTSLIVKNGQVIVRAPLRKKESEIITFVESHAGWVLQKLKESEARQKKTADIPKLTPVGIQGLLRKAESYIPGRVAHFAPLVGVTYGKITFRIYKSKWGSCMADGRLQFNILLMLAPDDVIDSVIVHELCHRKQMNHSALFYREVLKVMPDYYQINGWLKQHGPEIMRRGGF